MNKRIERLKKIPYGEIVRLRNEGLTYNEILIETYKNENGLKLDEEIVSLRNQKLTYGEIVAYYADKGIKIGSRKIRKIYESYYEKEKIEKPAKLQRRAERLRSISDEEVANLKNSGLTYIEIVNYYTNKGIKVSYGQIRNIYHNYYKGRNLEIPKIKRKRTYKLKYILDEEIVRLREQGLNYKEISNYFKEKGKNVSHETIRQRCKNYNKEKKSLEELNDKLNELIIKKEKTKELLQKFTDIIAKQRDNMKQKEKGETR